MSTNKGKPGRQPRSEEEHFMTCPTCGERFDCRDLGEVFEHLHGARQRGATEAMTVFVYVNTARQVGDADHINIFRRLMPRKDGSRSTTRKAWLSSTT